MPSESELILAVKRTESNGTRAQLANALDQLCAHYHKSGDYGRALPVYRRAAGLWREILGPTHPTVGTLFVNLGDVLMALGDVDEALPILRQALDICEADPDFSDDGALEVFERLRGKLVALGRRDEALILGERLRRITAQAPVLLHE